MRRFALPHSDVSTVSSPNLRRLSGTYVYVDSWRSAQVATRADRLKPGLTQVSTSGAGSMEARGRRGSGCAGCERRQIARRPRERAATWAASVGKSRAAARRRSEQRRSSSASADDGGGSKARLREQQAQINSVGPSKYELQGPTVQPELSDVSS